MKDDLMAAAIVGTERKPFVPPPGEGKLGRLLKTAAGQEPAGALLDAAAILFLYERAGFQPPQTTAPLVEASPEEQLPRCSQRSGWQLATILERRQTEVLKEFLLALKSAGRRVREENLPGLLDLALAEPGLAGLIEAVTGRRGSWLAGLNLAWYPLAELDSVAVRQVWENGTRQQRAVYLTRLRAARPEQARSRLETIWSQETADTRLALLEVLRSGLSQADEPFLETALDDRGQQVRRLAADLLARLPGSRLVKRMEAQAARLLDYQPPSKTFFNISLTRKSPLLVQPPDEPDKELQRDGVEVKSPYPALGNKGWWLLQVVAAVPPGYWTARWNVRPEELISAAARSEWASGLIGGWRAATERFGHAQWAEALTRYWLNSAERHKLSAFIGPTLKGLAYPQYEKIILDALQVDRQPLNDNHPAVELMLQNFEAEWSPALSRALAAAIKRSMQEAGRSNWKVCGGALERLAHRAPPALAEELTADWPEHSISWSVFSRQIEQSLATLKFRRDMLREISNR